MSCAASIVQRLWRPEWTQKVGALGKLYIRRPPNPVGFIIPRIKTVLTGLVAN
jgi:hypothetical protein